MTGFINLSVAKRYKEDPCERFFFIYIYILIDLHGFEKEKNPLSLQVLEPFTMTFFFLLNCLLYFVCSC